MRGLPAARAIGLAALLAPAAASGASISIQGKAIVLGKTESVPVLIRLEEPQGGEDRPLRLSVNVGSFSEPTRVAPGQYRATYVPPRTRFPQVAIAAVWRETGPEAAIDFLSFPLFGMTRVPVEAQPDTSISVKVGLDTFGPVEVGRKRRVVEVPVVVAPGVREATVIITHKGVSSTRQVALDVPPYSRLTAAVVPHAIPADGRSHARIDVFYELGGIALPPQRVQVRTSVGTVRFQGTARGRYVYRFEPPSDAQAKEARIEVAVEGDPTARAESRIALALPDPARLVVRAPQREMVAGSDEAVPVGVLVLDAHGMGLSGHDVEVSANGEPLGKAVHRGDGVYEIPLRAPAAYPAGGLVQLRATCRTRAGAALGAVANYQLAAAPTPKSVALRFRPDPVPSDGRTTAAVSIDVRDAAGLPLKSAQLILAASHGTLGALQERTPGRYEATYLAPEDPPAGETFIRVVDPGGSFERKIAVPLRQDPRRLLLGPRGGWVRGPGDLSGTRMGADAWMPVRAGGWWFGVGLSGSYGTVRRTVSDPVSGITSESDARFFPLALRAGWELWAGRRLSLVAGAGAMAVYASVSNDLAGESSAWGFGGMGFLSAGLSIGIGQAFVEASYARAPVDAPTFRLDPGGVGVEVGYRVGVF